MRLWTHLDERIETMKNMKRFVAWVALLALLLSSFAFAEEVILEEAAASEVTAVQEETAVSEEMVIAEEIIAEPQSEAGDDEAAELLEEEAVYAASENEAAAVAFCYHMWKRYEDNGDGTHTAYCSQCNVFMFVEEHYFYSGFCTDCNLQNGECEHLGRYAMDLGNGKHKFICSYCEQELGEEEHWEYCSSDWNECWECSAAGSWTRKHDFRYVHVEDAHGSHRLECTAWGCWEKDESTLAPHTYDANGVCTVCEYDANSCRYCYSHCDMPNVCVNCGRECEEVSHGTVSTVKYNEYFHADICNLCGEITYLSKHYVVCALGGKTCSEKYGCGAKVDPEYVDVEHVADSNGTRVDPSNPDYHYYTCRHCKKKISELHNVSCDTGDKFCYTCQTSVEQGKRHYSVDTSAKPVAYPGDAAKHGWACACGEVLYPTAHEYKNGFCTGCGAEKQGIRSVAFETEEISLLAGETAETKLIVDGAAVKTVYKASGSNIAVSADGVITAKKAGAATVTATVTGVDGETMSAKLKVTVQAVPTKITLKAKTLTLGVEESAVLDVTLAPKGAYDVLSWTSSDEAVAVVDANGNVTGVGEGSATITVETVNGKSASCKVTVLGAPATLNVDVSELMLNPKKSYSLKVQIASAAGGKCAGSPVFESSDPAVATVDAKGKITAKAAGASVISVSTYNGLVHQVQVSVFNLPKKVTLNTAAENLNMGDTLQLTASIAADEYTTFKWTTSNKKVAVVDENGFVTTLGEGKANITVKTANGKSAVCKLTVVDPFKPSGIELAQSGTVELALGSTLELNASLLPASAKSELKWTSSNKKIAEVDANGIVTPIKEGTVTITVATYNNKKDTVKVKVIDPKKCTGVELSQSGTVTIAAGETLQLEARLLPVTAETTLTWTSSNKKLAEVDENGLVTAVKAGTVTITVKTANGKKDTVKIKVV